MRRTTLPLVLSCLAGCTALTQDSLDKRYGPADPRRFDTALPVVAGGVSYRDDVQPVLERRCVVCHGCYDAPCQLKLGAWEGVARGATQAQVYNATRLDEAPPTRLFFDAQQPSQWRQKGFFPVLKERTPSPENNLAASVLYRSLAHKRAHPLPDENVLSNAFDFSLDRSQSCPRLDQYDACERDHPKADMPYGLPGLNDREQGVLTRWLAAGSPNDAPLPLPPEREQFLNGRSNKERLMSRYLYEHLFLGHLVFEGDPQHRAFRIVRSAAAPGTPGVPLATRRPYDDPGVATFYYRLVPERETPLAKTHMPYLLSPARMAKYRGWFIDAVYSVDVLPSYAAGQASNPFIAFAELPPESRYRFVLDAPALRAWRELERSETRVLAAKAELWNQRFGGAQKIGLAAVWDGDGHDPNAALTVFRHFDSASVVKGLVGGPPKTAWVIGYPLFERIYYLLVAGYDPFGNLGHQLTSRLYMDFMRMEGETNFLLLLPKAVRGPTRDFWYRGASADAKSFVDRGKGRFNLETGIVFRTQDPQRELYGLLGARLAPVLSPRFEIASVADPALRDGLLRLASVTGAGLSWLPEAAVLRVDDAPRAPRYFSLLRDTGHGNVSHLLTEKAELLPDENTLTVVQGFIGACPNAIYRATKAELPALAAAIAKLGSEADYRVLADRFVIRRTSPAFWAASDAMVDAYAQWAPLEAGLFDYNRLDNR